MIILILKSVFSELAQSVVVVGLSYGFLTTLSIGPSYFFLMKTRAMEEQSERYIASTTGFVVGQLMMFVSVFYLPMHLVLSQPHTISILVGLYFFFHFLSYKNADFLDYESGPTTKNLIRKFSIHCFFMNNLILQLLNLSLLPNSTLARLVNIYMFRCNNKILFVISSFVAWFIGQILLTKCFELVFFWIRQTYAYAYGSKKYKGFLLHWKFTLLDWTYISSKNQVFRILSVTICLFYFGRVQYLCSLDFRNQQREEKKLEVQERKEEMKEEEQKRQEKRNGKTTFKTKDTQKDTKLVIQDQLGFQEMTYLRITKMLVTPLFDFRRFYRPLRYIRNNSLYENSVQDIPVQNKMGQYYFGTCLSDGIKRISMKYRPGFEDFLEWLPKRIAFVYSFLFQKQIKLRRLSKSSKSQEYLYQNWISKNEQKKYNLINELRSRIKVLEEKEGFFVLDMLEKRTRLCNDKNEQECFSKHKDPLLNGPNRNTIDISEIERFRKWIITNSKNEDLKETMEKSEKMESFMEDSKEKEETKKELGSMPIPILDPITSIKFMSPFNRLRMMERIARTSRRTLYTIIVTEKIVTEKNSEKTEKSSEKVTKIPKFTRVLPDIFADEYAEMQKNVPTWVRGLRDAVEILEEISDDNKGAEEEEEEERPDEGKDAEEEEEEEGKREIFWMADIFLRRFKRIPIYTIDKDDIDEDDIDEDDIDEDMLEEDMLEDEKKIQKEDMLEDEKKIQKNNDTKKDNDTNDTEEEEEPEQVALIHYLRVTDSDRDLIRGSMRALRRKTVVWDLYQPQPRSPIFLDRTENTVSSFFRRRFFSVFDIFLKLFERINFPLRNSAGRKLEWKISQEEETKEMDSEEEKKNREMERKQEIKQSEEDQRELLARVWNENQHIRGFLLLTQSFLRKKIVLPSLIIAKNLVRMILSQSSEWDEDFKECEKEIHVKCTYDGLELSETEFPQNWLSEGIQIKILFPFCLKPWRTQNREEKPRKSCFLTVLGKETNVPFGSARRQPSFFRPIYKELKKKMRKVQKKFLPLFEVLKEKKGGIIQKGNKRKVYERTENGKDSKINKNIINEPTIGIGSMNWTIESLIERKIQDFSDGTIRIRNEIEQITKENNKILFTCDDKRTESQKSIWKIFQRKSIRLIRKFHYFRKFFIEKTYINILLWMINNLSRTRINSQLFFESIKKRIKKFIYKNKTNQEGRKETVNFFCTQKKNQDYDLSSLSQAYVFYKISQSALLNKYNLRSLLQYHETYPFIKDQIKDYCRGIFDSKSRHNKMTKSQLWKNWLRGHYQYNLSQNKWSQLDPQEWRNRIQQHYMFPNKDSMTLDSYQKEKDNVIDYVKENPYGFDPLSSRKEKLQKQYRYDLLSNIYMNFGDKKDKKDLAIYRFGNIAISDHLEDTFFLWKNKDKKYLDRKYLDCRILLTKNSNIDTCTNNNKLIKTWVHTLIAGYKNTQERIKNKNTQTEEDQKEDKKENSNKKKEFLDWKKMNQEYKKRNEEREKIVRSKPWFFPELVLLLNAYKKKPWITPIQLLLFDLDLCQDTKNDKKKEPELVQEKTTKKSKKEKKVQVHFGTHLRKELGEEEKKMEVRKVNDIEEFYFLLKQSFLHQFKLDNPHIREDIMSNIEGGYHLLKLWKEYLKKKEEGGPISRTRDPKKMVSATISKQELDLQPMSIVRDSNPSESGRILLENKFLIFEEFRLCQKIDEKSILYQMLSIDTSLVNKNQHQTQDFLRPEDILSSRRCRELRILSSFNYPNVTDRKSFYINKYMNRFDFNKENITNSDNENDITNSGNENDITNSDNENDITNSGQLLNVFNEEELNKDANEFVKCKSFLWPNYRLEDLLCMNRYWFDTNNGSRFSMLRIRMYPQSRIQK